MGQVALAPPRRRDLAQGRQAAPQLETQLAVLAQQQNLGGHVPARLVGLGYNSLILARFRCG